MSLSRKRKKQLRKLQKDANTLWESQQVLLGQAGDVAREAGRQLGNYSREQVVPTVQHGYEKYAAPVVSRGLRTSAKVYNERLAPAAGAVIGSALSVWDAANEKRDALSSGRGFGAIDVDKLQKKAQKYGKNATKRLTVTAPPAKKKMGAGGVLAIIFGIAAAAGVVYAAWQTLRADDELWVADDPLRAPDA
ncbi:DNA helicase [Microbacterium sp.]|uniref:DNA helicase n=1 Tax=Microbacterium sp. TaxID=51671 RepID=UPI0039E65B01